MSFPFQLFHIHARPSSPSAYYTKYHIFPHFCLRTILTSSADWLEVCCFLDCLILCQQICSFHRVHLGLIKVCWSIRSFASGVGKFGSRRRRNRARENHILLVSSSQDGLEMIVEEIRASSEIRHLLDYSTPQYGESLEKRSEQQSHKRKKFLIVLYRFVNMQMNCSTIPIPTIVFIWNILMMYSLL